MASGTLDSGKGNRRETKTNGQQTQNGQTTTRTSSVQPRPGLQISYATAILSSSGASFLSSTSSALPFFLGFGLDALAHTGMSPVLRKLQVH